MNQAPGQNTSPESQPVASHSNSASLPKYRYLDLCPSGKEVLIEYEGQIYRLRSTRNGKLILNK